jgi:hypothetical protein
MNPHEVVRDLQVRGVKVEVCEQDGLSSTRVLPRMVARAPLESRFLAAYASASAWPGFGPGTGDLVVEVAADYLVIERPRARSGSDLNGTSAAIAPGTPPKRLGFKPRGC